MATAHVPPYNHMPDERSGAIASVPPMPMPPPLPPMTTAPSVPTNLETHVAVFQKALHDLRVAEHDLANAKAAVLNAKQDLIEAIDYAGM